MDKTILIVEDDIVAYGLYKAILQDEGYNIKNANNGKKAIEYCKKQKPDLIIMDVNLGGGLDGIETVMELYKIYEDIKVIYSTGYSDNEYVKKMVDTDPVGIIFKPVDSKQLMYNVNRFI